MSFDMSPELIDSGVIIIAGAIASLLTAWINKSWWTSKRRQWVSFGVSVVLGVLALVLKGVVFTVPTEPFEFVAWVITTIALVAGASQVIYAQFSEKLRELEEALPSPLPGKRFETEDTTE